MSDKSTNLLGTGISAAVGGLGVIGNIIGQNKANATNLQIARENNRFNAQMIREQNEYNSAVNQRQRLEQAGLNPYLMMNGGSAGTQTTAPTADQTGKQLPVDFSSVLQLSDQLRQSAVLSSQVENNNANTENINADTQAKQIDNATRLSENIARIKKLLADTKDAKERARLNEYMADLQDMLNSSGQWLNSKIAEPESNIELNAARREEAVANYRRVNALLPYEKRESVARISKLYADGKLSRAQARAAVANAIGQEKQNYITEQAMDDFIDRQGLENDKLEQDIYTGRSQEFGNYNSSIVRGMNKGREDYLPEKNRWYNTGRNVKRRSQRNKK